MEFFDYHFKAFIAKVVESARTPTSTATWTKDDWQRFTELRTNLGAIMLRLAGERWADPKALSNCRVRAELQHISDHPVPSSHISCLQSGPAVRAYRRMLLRRYLVDARGNFLYDARPHLPKPSPSASEQGASIWCCTLRLTILCATMKGSWACTPRCPRCSSQYSPLHRSLLVCLRTPGLLKLLFMLWHPCSQLPTGEPLHDLWCCSLLSELPALQPFQMLLPQKIALQSGVTLKGFSAHACKHLDDCWCKNPCEHNNNLCHCCRSCADACVYIFAALF